MIRLAKAKWPALDLGGEAESAGVQRLPDEYNGEAEKSGDSPAESANEVETSTESPAADEPDIRGSRARRSGTGWARVLTYGVLAPLALLLAMFAGYLKWCDVSVRDSRAAASDSVRAAIDSTVAMLSYKADTVDKDLAAARDKLTGSFRDSYISLTNDVVIPGAKQRQISAVATVPAAASVSARQNHAVVLVFVNQTITVGNDPPTDSASSVKVALEKIGNRWLVSQFDPV